MQKTGKTGGRGTDLPNVERCAWAASNPLYLDYHDREWGVPVYDDRRLFEFLILEGAQAGLSWLTILKKRENYRAAFAGFDPERVARFGEAREGCASGQPRHCPQPAEGGGRPSAMPGPFWRCGKSSAPLPTICGVSWMAVR